MICFCEYLQNRINANLPGTEAQRKMAPFDGNNRASHPPQGIRYHESAVLILLTRPAFDDNGYQVLLTLRSNNVPTHKGQISLPGGRIEKGETDIDTACRETKEEVGIQPTEIEIVGRLSSLYIPSSLNYVHPVVSCAIRKPELMPDKREVDEAFFVSLNELDKPETLRTANWLIRNTTYQVPFWHVHETTPLWGATAMILSELLELYREFGAKIVTNQ